MRRELMPHQRKTIQHIDACGGKACIWLAPGTGKTLTAIRWAEKRKPILVICRRDDFLTWLDELAKEEYSPLSIDIIDKAFAYYSGPANEWTLVTYDLLKNEKVRKWVESRTFRTVIADEGHYLRHPSSRFRAVYDATRHIPHRIHLTGTPWHQLSDVFHEILWVDDGETFGDNFYRFCHRYYHRLPHGGWSIKRGSDKLITRKLSSVAIQIQEDDVLILPKKRFLLKGAPLSAEQRKQYQRILEEWEAEIDGEIIEYRHTVVQLQKLQQVASGFLLHEGVPTWFKSGKLDTLHRLVKDGELVPYPKVVVWCSRTAEIIKLTKELREYGKVVSFFGSNRRRKETARHQFKKDRDTRFFVAQVDSGTGMNELTVANAAVYFSNSQKLVSRQQSMRRTRRYGSEKHSHCLYIDLVSEDTIDMKLLLSLQRKMSLADEIHKELKKGRALRDTLGERDDGER